VIRFGVVLTVVLAAMGLLASGVLANSLLLVYLAIGAAALAAIMLTAGVLIWREEVFGPSSAAQASPAAKQAAGPSPVLAATGVAQPGRSAGGAAGDVVTIGALAQDDFVVEPPPPALPPRPDWAGRLEPQRYPDWPAPPQQQEQPDWLERSDQPGREEQLDRARPVDRPEQPDWAERPDRPERSEHLEPRKAAEPAARQGSAGQERASGSPSGARPEPLAEPVPGPRRGDEPASDGLPPASRGAAGADELRPRPARGPVAQSLGERGADVPAWSFFNKPGKPSVARPDLTQVVGAEAGAVQSGESAGPGTSRELTESGEPGRSREDDESPKAARTAGAAGPDAARAPVTGTAEGADRAAAEPTERDAPAEPPEPGPAEPEPVSAAAEHAAPDGAAVAGPEAEDLSPAGTAVRDGHAVRGPDTEVTVVPGITRYHRSQCILIRFLGPEDVQSMTRQAAEMASYVPCKACRPEQVLADD
jgi:hypothetical protein